MRMPSRWLHRSCDSLERLVFLRAGLFQRVIQYCHIFVFKPPGKQKGQLREEPSFMRPLCGLGFSINPLSPKGDQHQISPCNINTL